MVLFDTGRDRQGMYGHQDLFLADEMQNCSLHHRILKIRLNLGNVRKGEQHNAAVPNNRQNTVKLYDLPPLCCNAS